MTAKEKTITLGVSDWDELSSHIINDPNTSPYLKSVAEKIRKLI